MIITLINFIGSVLTKEEMEKLAKAILLAQDIREESYHKESCRYTLTQRDAAERAVSQVYGGMYLASFIDLIEDLNGYYWNDIQEIAKDIIKEK
jgi:hypothetical protein